MYNFNFLKYISKIFCHIFKYFSLWSYLKTGNNIMLTTRNSALKPFLKFFYAKVHLQYKHNIYEVTTHKLSHWSGFQLSTSKRVREESANTANPKQVREDWARSRRSEIFWKPCCHPLGCSLCLPGPHRVHYNRISKSSPQRTSLNGPALERSWRFPRGETGFPSPTAAARSARGRILPRVCSVDF